MNRNKRGISLGINIEKIEKKKLKRRRVFAASAESVRTAGAAETEVSDRAGVSNIHNRNVWFFMKSILISTQINLS